MKKYPILLVPLIFLFFFCNTAYAGCGWELHHLFPQDPSLRPKFVKLGIDVHGYTVLVRTSAHNKWGKGSGGGDWNKDWHRFFSLNPNPTKEQVFANLAIMCVRYKIFNRIFYRYHVRGACDKKYRRESGKGKIDKDGKVKRKKVTAKTTTNKAKMISKKVKTARSRLRGALKTLPPSSRRIVQTGGTALIISGLGNVFDIVKGEKHIEKAVINTLTDGAKWTAIDAATEVAPAIVQKIGNKYVATVLSQLGHNMGLFTFVFDEAHLIYNFTEADLTLKEFISETGKNVLRASVVAGVQYICAGVVLLQAIPGGGIVLSGIVIGSYFLVSKGIQYAEELNQRNYFFIEDVLGKLPLTIQNKITPFSDPKQKETPFSVDNDKVTPFGEKSLKPTPFNEERTDKVTPFSIN